MEVIPQLDGTNSINNVICHLRRQLSKLEKMTLVRIPVLSAQPALGTAKVAAVKNVNILPQKRDSAST